MTWINPLDKIPQLRVDWANHIFWSGITGTACLFLGAIPFHIFQVFTPQTAFLIALAQSLVKKSFDYFVGGEGWGICLAKGFISPFFPFAFYVYTLIKHL